MGAIPSRLLSLSEEYSATLANPLNLGKVGLLGARGYQWLLELGIQRAVRLAIREDADDCYVGRGYWSLSHGKNPKVGMRRFRILYAREKRSMFREYSARAILNQNPGNHRAQFATLTLYFGRSGLRDRLLSDRTLSRGSNNWQGKERRKDLRGKISFRRRKNRDLRDHENEALILDLIQESPGDSKESQISKKKRQGRRVIPGAQVIDSTPSVFVSYSHKDSEFVDRVIGYLQPRGIDCWRDVHDLVAGPMDAQIDEALGKQKAVLVVLSSSSVDSDWVEREAIAAREEEKRLSVSHGQARYRLCPVALDGAWKTCAWPAWLRNQIKKYNVLDLSKWKSQPDFQMQMDKLVDGLLKYYRK